MNEEKVEKLVKKILSEQLGLETEDISGEESLTQDLHMTLGDLSEFREKLIESGFPEIDISRISTIQDLVDTLSSEEL